MSTRNISCECYIIGRFHNFRMYMYIKLGDGIYDKLTNAEVIEVVWDTFRRDKGSFSNLH